MTFEQEKAAVLNQIKEFLDLNDSEVKTLSDRLWCFSSKIRQPRKDDGTCNKTPYFERWDTDIVRSHITNADPRYATELECERIYLYLLAKLFEVESDKPLNSENIETFSRIVGQEINTQNLLCIQTSRNIIALDIKSSLHYSTQRLGSYDIPISYNRELNQGGRHMRSNVGWLKPIHIVYELREVLKRSLLDIKVPSKAVKNALDKIQVKAYCTDKVTMPPFYSNRDVRWATWANSIQYASHFECTMIELELMAELFEFTGTPALNQDIKNRIEAILGREIQYNTRRCFITGKEMVFNDYLNSAVNTNGGRSAYHVGHIQPLTREGLHSYTNISWTSDDGNRIQGNDTISEIEEKLISAVIYHLQRDSASPNHNFYEKLDRLESVIRALR